MTHCKLTRIAVIFACIYGHAANAAESIEYDPSFLMGSSAQGIDLSRYSDGNPAMPGSYDVKVYVNESAATSMTVELIDTGKKSADACISRKMLNQLHIKQPDLKDGEAVLRKGEAEADDCLDLARAIPQSEVYFDTNDQKLDITVPQIWILSNYQGYIDPSLWEDGISAAMLSYRMNGWRNTRRGDETQSFYTALNAGLNLGNWHFRSNGNYSWQQDVGGNFDIQNSYMQRELPFIRSQLVVGETYTTGETFDSVGIKGARLYSDDRMLPPSMTSFAPVIRGVANSNAKVTITQGGYKIYEGTVPPGEFAIDDIMPSGYGNDLVVTIEEADGSRRTFSQPFSSVMQMLRPGVGRWDLSGGQIVRDDLREDYNLLQGSFYYGINNTFTGYTGIQFTDADFMAVLLGLGVNTSIGAVSLDVTQSKANIYNDQTYTGQSYRISWNKMFSATNTSLNLAAYRYSTSNYLGLNDALTLQDDARHSSPDEQRTMGNYQRTRNQFTISLNQPLMFEEVDYGSFYLNGSWTDYWSGSHSQSTYSMGYSKGTSWGTWSATVQRTWNEDGDQDDSFYLSFSIPLENLLGGKRRESGFKYLDSRMSTDFNGSHRLSASANGSSGDGKYNYSVNTNYSTNKQSSNLADIGGYLSYESQWGTWSGSASADTDHSRQLSLSTDGGFVLHGGGLTYTNHSFSDTDTLVLVKAPGAHGARINYSSNTIDRWGYGVATSASPYRENNITLDIQELENDVELKSTSSQTVPRYGAITMTSFETDQGRSAMISMRRSDGEPLPFAANITNEQGQSLGYIGQNNQAFVRGIEDNGVLQVNWSDKDNVSQHCIARYQVPASAADQRGNQTLSLDNVLCTVSATH
ncbi:outer membrane usher protein [Escherichia marmotae]|uniref:outer membrane usher protein n=1 Tax=Escherichia marmotae TaxID=1499973 RepID=UPI001C9B1BCF|nr:outer membrane usher protein [Escherichia marmotae]MBY7470982.1 outer membrane usher protein [Escherichia marmotae]MBY7545691.1 outer membrane usher protein [Escherichia marmotae]